MADVARAQTGSADDVCLGAYLTDGRRLFWVKDAAGGFVALENCRVPGERPEWRPVAVVLRELRRVVPS